MFSAVVVVMLALGIGANTAVFSVMNAVLLRLLPVERPGGVYYVHMANGQNQPPGAEETGDLYTPFSMPVFEALRQRTDIFEDLIGHVPLSFDRTVTVRHGEFPESASGEEVSGNFFSGLGVRMERGRGFSLEDERSHAAIAVLSYDYWRRSFARDPEIVGQTIYVKGVPVTVVGIAAYGFRGAETATATDFWIPLQTRGELNAWGRPAKFGSLYDSPKWWALRIVARLREGVSPMQAQEALAGTLAGVVKQTIGDVAPTRWKPLLGFVPARGIVGYDDRYRTPVRILMGLVGLVLLVACTNVAMMVQARNTLRQYEFSLRMAMGARQGTIFMQLFCESVLLVGAGALLGWMFAIWATRVLASLSGIDAGLNPDTTVLYFTLAISVLAALTFSLVPLWRAVRAPVAGVLRSTPSNSTATRDHVVTGRVVLSTQIAICLVLLMASGLLLSTLRNYSTQKLGMEAEGLLVFGVTPPPGEDGHIFFREMLDRVRQMPGVAAVSMVRTRPGTGWADNNYVTVDGVRREEGFALRTDNVGPGYFHTIGVPILSGRDITDADTQESATVAIVNETFVKKYLSETDPLGHVLGSGRYTQTIVGVVKDSKYTSVDEKPRPMAYFSAMQASDLATMHMEVRTRGDAMSMVPEMRKAIAAMHPTVALEKPMTQKMQFDESYQQQRMFGMLGGFFGGLAALLVATGLYGTYSFRVNRRRAEIGIRMALGASRAQMLAMVMRESLWVMGFGLPAGVPLTLLAVRPLKSMLYGVSPVDPMAFGEAIAVLILVSACSALVPARRAASVEPMEALRSE
jgi:predicted permease